jgi:hypothetical protein
MTPQPRYMVSVLEPEGNGRLTFTFAPLSDQPTRGNGSVSRRVPQFMVGVRQEAGGLAFDWSGTPDEPGTARTEIEREIATRMKERGDWIDRLNVLVAQMEQWAKEMGWSTRRIEKKLEDARIGTHRVPALLMQEDTCRVLLEPVGRTTPGTEGAVDLYLMPAYDDLASLYYYGGRWNLHYLFPEAKPAATVREAEPLPLTKEMLAKVLAELRQHAA